MRCHHVFQPKGKFYNRRQMLLGGEVFTVFGLKECEHCSKTEKKVLLKKRVTDSADTFERKLKFSGVKPEHLLN